MKGVRSIKASFQNKSAIIEFDEGRISAQEVARAMSTTEHMMGADMQYGGILVLSVEGVKDGGTAKKATAALKKVAGVAKVILYAKQEAVGIQFTARGKTTSKQLLEALAKAGLKGAQYVAAPRANPLMAGQPGVRRSGRADNAFAGGQWQRGEILYRQNCASCHLGDLRGRCMAPSLAGVTAHLTDKAIVAHARAIGDAMCCARHIQDLSDRDFADIVAYLHAFDTVPAVRARAAAAGTRGGCCCAR